VNPIAAERAAGHHGTFLDSGTLLSVEVLSSRLAAQMNVQLARDGSLVFGDGSGGSSSLIGRNSGSDLYGGDSDALLDGRTLSGLRQRSTLGSDSTGVFDSNSRTSSSRAGQEGRVLTGRYRIPGDTTAASASAEDAVGAGTVGSGIVSGSELYLQPHRRKSICERIVEYFFSY